MLFITHGKNTPIPEMLKDSTTTENLINKF